ncbi:MAG: hypothetical protein H6633_24685 [Anaerolineales bacterium]|nr:hypothetical protein [Anaerolineales bacterium]
MLLKADVDGPAWTDAQIAEAFNCRSRTVEKVRERLVVDGFALASMVKTGNATDPTQT